MRKRELIERAGNIVYDALNSTSIHEEVESLLKKLDETRRLNRMLLNALLVAEEQLTHEIMAEYIISDIKQIRTAITKAQKSGMKWRRR